MLKHTVAAFAVSAALGATALLPAAASAQDHEPRMYDRAHKDYHDWNGDEDRAYRDWMQDHHHKYKEFKHLSKKQQREYWKWRHDHMK